MEIAAEEADPSGDAVFRPTLSIASLESAALEDESVGSPSSTLLQSRSMPVDLEGSGELLRASTASGASRLRMSQYRLTKFQSKTLPDLRSMRALCHDVHFCSALVADQNHWDAIAMVEYHLEMLFATHDEDSNEVCSRCLVAPAFGS